MSSTSTSTIEALALRAAILDTLATFCERIDEYDCIGAAAVFTQDCYVDYGKGRGGPVRGRAALAQRFREGQGEFRLTHHQLGQTRICLAERGGANVATAITYLTAWHERWNGERCWVRLRYIDDFRYLGERVEIASRIVHVAGTEGFDGVEWDWVSRAVPPAAS